MKTEPKASIYDIAKETGVSVSTVSRVLNGNPRISKATKAKVSEAIKQLNYVPAPPNKRPGNRFKKEKSQHKILFYTESWMNQPLLEGLQSELSNLGNTLTIISNSKGDYNLSLLTGKANQPDGIIFLGTPEQLASSGLMGSIPSVQVFGHTDIPGIDYGRVSYNQKQIASIAADYLAETGVTHVGIYYQNGLLAAEERMALFKIQVQRKGLETTDLSSRDAKQVYTPLPSENLKDYISAKSAPYGFFAFNDSQGSHLMMQLSSLGLELNKDYYLISCDNTQQLHPFYLTAPASIDIDFYGIGRAAGRMLLRKLANPQEPMETISIEPKLVTNEDSNSRTLTAHDESLALEA